MQLRALSVWTCLFLTACICFPSVAQEPAPRPGKVLIERLIAIAEAGRLTDSSFVGNTLRMAFTGQLSTMEPFARTCAPGYTKQATTVRSYTPASDLGPTSFGRPSIVRPGFGLINSQPAEISGPTKIIYYVSENHDCSGYVQSGNDIDANLDIGPLSTYDCISPVKLLGWFPKIVRGYATDGAEVYYYQSHNTDSNGSTLSFNSFFGTQCILGIRLTQRSSDSTHYRAAKQRQEACMLPHEEQFCRIHSPFGWGDGDVQDEMAAFAVKQCGALDKFLASTRMSATPINQSTPPEEGDPNKSTPCSRVHAALQQHRQSRK